MILNTEEKSISLGRILLTFFNAFEFFRYKKEKMKRNNELYVQKMNEILVFHEIDERKALNVTAEDNLEKDNKKMSTNKLSLNSELKLNNQETIKKVVKVLRFIREVVRVPAKDIAELMKGEYHSRSLIAAVESGLRKPSPEFLAEYAAALQKMTKVESDLLFAAFKCAEDSELMDLMHKYYDEGGDFRVARTLINQIYDISHVEENKTK